MATTNAGKDMEPQKKQKFSFIADGNGKWYSHFGKRVWHRVSPWGL